MKIFDENDPNKMDGANRRLLAEGTHIAEVESVEIFRSFETQYGTKDGILVKLTVKQLFMNHKIVKRLFWSEHYTSAMMKFLNACFKNSVPEKLSVQQLAGRKLGIDVIHKPASNGKIYAEIVDYHEFIGNDTTDEQYYDEN